MNILNFLNYDFIQRAYVSGIFIAILCSLLGVFLVLRKWSLISDGLAHLSFGAIALGLVMGIYPFYVAIPVVILASIFILKLTQTTRMNADTAIGIVSSVGLASGIIIASLSKGFNVDLFAYLFGNILAVSNNELWASIILSVLVTLIIILFYHDFFAVTFDEDFARVLGVHTERVNLTISILTSLAVILAVKVVGVVLASSMVILPAITSLQISRTFKTTLVNSALFAVLSVVFGITASYFANLPTGASIVITNFLIFIIVFTFKKIA